MSRVTSRVKSPQPRVAARLKGHDKSRTSAVLKSNALSAHLVAEIMRRSFGPKGLDKMFVDKIGQTFATSDGATILQKSESNHPIARIITELGKSVDTEVGDGVISAVIVMSALLEGAARLIERGVHPSTIVRGYTLTLQKTLSELEEIAEPVPAGSKEWLIKVASTSMHTKLAAKGSKELPELLATAAIQVADRTDNNYTLDTNRIAVKKHPGGGSLADTRLIHGFVLEKDLIDRDMPKQLENVKIVVGDVSLVVKKTIADHKISMTDPRTIAKLGLDRRARLKEMSDRIIASGAKVLINREGCDDLVAHHLAQAGIMAVRHAKIGDVTHIAEATGATVVDAKRDITAEDLGFAALVEERKVEGAKRTSKWLFIEGCKDPKATTILLRGGNWWVVEEADRSIHDALRAIKSLMERPAVVAGGGAIEAELSSRILKWSISLEGREQLAAEEFANSLEEIPLALAKSAGMDTINAIAEIKSKHALGGKWFGVDVKERKVTDTYVSGIIEPLAVKETVLKAATETACLILRIDGIFDKEKPRAYRRRSEMPKEEKKGHSREVEELHNRADKFDPEKPVDRRYPL